MDKETFNEAWKWLEKYQGRSLSEFATNVYWKDFENIDGDIFCRAVIASKDKFPPGKFPGISDLRNLLSVVRESNWKREKQMHAPLQRSRMGKEALRLILRRWFDHPDKLNSYQLAAEMMTDLESKYPGLGWALKGTELLEWLEKHEKNKEEKKEIGPSAAREPGED